MKTKGNKQWSILTKEQKVLLKIWKSTLNCSFDTFRFFETHKTPTERLALLATPEAQASTEKSYALLGAVTTAVVLPDLKIGMSFCSPKDLPFYSKEFGQFHSLARTFTPAPRNIDRAVWLLVPNLSKDSIVQAIKFYATIHQIQWLEGINSPDSTILIR